VQLVGVGWGFEEDPQHQVPRRRAWRASALPLADEWLFNPTQIAFSAWGFEEQSPRIRPYRLHAHPQADEFLTQPTAAVFVAWAFDEEAHRLKNRPRWLAHPQPVDNEGWPFTTAAVAPVYYEEEAHRLQRRIVRVRLQPDDTGGFPFIPPPPIIWGWEQPDWRARGLLETRIRRVPIDDVWPFPFAPPPPPPVIVLPNGRWRSVVASGESFLTDDNYLSPIVGEIGFALFFDTGLASSALLPAMTLTFVKPSGEILAVGHSSFFGGIDPVAGNLSVQRNFVRYIFGPGDLDEAGRWAVYLTIGSSRASGIAYFRVLSQIEALLN
jgi:hypothetical protein